MGYFWRKFGGRTVRDPLTMEDINEMAAACGFNK